MASIRRLKRNACTGKQRFANQTEAVKQIILVKKIHGDHMKSYKCPHCSGWHTGHGHKLGL